MYSPSSSNGFQLPLNRAFHYLDRERSVDLPLPSWKSSVSELLARLLSAPIGLSLQAWFRLKLKGAINHIAVLMIRGLSIAF